MVEKYLWSEKGSHTSSCEHGGLSIGKACTHHQCDPPKGHPKPSTTMGQLHIFLQCPNKPIAQPAVCWGGDR